MENLLPSLIRSVDFVCWVRNTVSKEKRTESFSSKLNLGIEAQGHLLRSEEPSGPCTPTSTSAPPTVSVASQWFQHLCLYCSFFFTPVTAMTWRPQPGPPRRWSFHSVRDLQWEPRTGASLLLLSRGVALSRSLVLYCIDLVLVLGTCIFDIEVFYMFNNIDHLLVALEVFFDIIKHRYRKIP